LTFADAVKNARGGDSGRSRVATVDRDTIAVERLQLQGASWPRIR
jgi:hypothetical protein